MDTKDLCMTFCKNSFNSTCYYICLPFSPKPLNNSKALELLTSHPLPTMLVDLWSDEDEWRGVGDGQEFTGSDETSSEHRSLALSVDKED